MAGSPLGLGNLILRKRAADEMSRMRQQQQQKAHEPTQTDRARIENNNQALVILPHLLMATKKVLVDEQRENKKGSKVFQAKYWRALQTYQSTGEGIVGNIKQQLFFNAPQDQTTKDLMRYFNLAGRFYGMSLPAITAQTGLRGKYVAQLFDPHIPNYDRTPRQTWERTMQLYPSLLSSYRQNAADPLYGGWTKRNFAATAQGNREFRQLFSDEEYDGLAPGIFRDKHLPRGAVKFGDGPTAKYRDLDSGKSWTGEDTAAITRPLPLMKSSSYRVEERPVPSGIGTTIIPSRVKVVSGTAD